MNLLLVVDYVNAFIVIFIAILGVAFIPEIRKKLWLTLLIIALGIISFIYGIIKIKEDKKKESFYSEKITSLETNLATISQRDSILQDKVDSNNVFLKRLEKLGIKDSANRPYFIISESTKFKANSITNATNVESHNQKGGQTAREITNN